MHYILPTRDLIANDIEMMIEAHRLDGVVLLGSCDKIVPGMLMAAARMDVPAILVAGGPMAGGCEFDGRAADITALTEALGMLKTGKIDRKRIPPSGKWCRAGLRLLFLPRDGQHHVLSCGGSGAEPSRERDHPGHPSRPSAGRPGVGETDRADDHGRG